MRPVAIILCVLGACGAVPEPAPEAASPKLQPPVLLNGSFVQGLSGWVAEGDASAFRVFSDPKNGMRPSVTTFVPDGVGGEAVGTLSQSFVVPEDAAALRFVLHGGHERVRLYEGDRELRQAAGPGSNDTHVLVNWSLVQHRGKLLKLAITDTSAKPPWAFVSVSGFDIVREQPSPLKNPGFEDGLNGWDAEGDASRFAWFRDPVAGNRWSVSSAIPTPGAPIDAARGVLSQRFLVPDDALALRFAVHGGTRGAVRLWRDDVLVAEASGSDTNKHRTPVSWDLRPLRGSTVKIALEDKVVDGPFGFIGTTGFDVITEHNGP